MMSTAQTPGCEAEVILEAGMQISGGRTLDIGGVEHLLHHEDLTLVSLAHLRPAPLRATGVRKLISIESFLTYVGRHASLATVIYGDRARGTLVAVFNDHEAGEEPGWRDHRATLQCERSEAWEAWRKTHRTPIPQAAFCDFLEDHLVDVLEPTDAELLELLRDLKGRKDVAWSSGVNLDNGDVQLSYSEATTAESGRRGFVVIPKEIVLALEIFRGVPHYKVNCRLRYRVAEGRLLFLLVIDRLADLEDDAFRDVLKMVKAGVDTDVLLVEGEAG